MVYLFGLPVLHVGIRRFYMSVLHVGFTCRFYKSVLHVGFTRWFYLSNLLGNIRPSVYVFVFFAVLFQVVQRGASKNIFWMSGVQEWHVH